MIKHGIKFVIAFFFISAIFLTFPSNAQAVVAIKSIRSALPQGMGMNFHNFEDGKDLNFSGEQTKSTNTWVPYQTSGKQIRIQLKNEGNNEHVDGEFYLWDDNYKLQCSTPDGIKTILTFSGSHDVGITVNLNGVQANYL